MIFNVGCSSSVSNRARATHDDGLMVNVCTVDEPERLRELGVDGIITDYPDRLRRLLEEMGMPVRSAVAGLRLD